MRFHAILTLSAAALAAAVPAASGQTVCQTVGDSFSPLRSAACVTVTTHDETGNLHPSVRVGCTLFQDQAVCAIKPIEP
jgi:hypothetical protein